jgi:hypothetical protein
LRLATECRCETPFPPPRLAPLFCEESLRCTHHFSILIAIPSQHSVPRLVTCNQGRLTTSEKDSPYPPEKHPLFHQVLENLAPIAPFSALHTSAAHSAPEAPYSF